MHENEMPDEMIIISDESDDPEQTCNAINIAEMGCMNASESDIFKNGHTQ